MRLHIDFRPKELSDVIGNKATINSLRSVLESKNPPRAYLFSGQAGCGKTTLGRIVANSLGTGIHDLREINSADFRGIDTVREIIRTMGLAPLNGERKAYIIDECHKLTSDAQNALLKPLEDTPEHVVFILATTDPGKLIKAIKDRCAKYEVSPLETSELRELLSSVVSDKKLDIGRNTIRSIISAVEGSPRAALVALGMVAEAEEEDVESIIKNFRMDDEEVIELCRAMNRKGVNWRTLSPILRNLTGEDPEKIRRIMISYFSKVLLSKDDPIAFSILDVFRNNVYDSGFPGIVWACREFLFMIEDK